MLVDTGAALSYISYEAAARLGVKMRWGDMGENRQPTDRRTIATLGSRSQPDLVVRMTVADKSDKMPGGFDGIWGIDQLQRFAAAELDWASGKLRLYGKSYDYSKEKGTMYSLPVEFRHSLEALGSTLPFTKVKIGSGADEVEVDGLIDTGSPVTVVGIKVAERAQMCAAQIEVLLPIGTPPQSQNVRAELESVHARTGSRSMSTRSSAKPRPSSATSITTDRSWWLASFGLGGAIRFLANRPRRMRLRFS